METCPNCGTSVMSKTVLCPQCGMILHLGQMGKLLTGNRTGDIILGVILGLILVASYGVGIIVIPILFLTLRGSYVAFARGLGIALMTLLALTGLCILGALVVCFGGLAFSSMQHR